MVLEDMLHTLKSSIPRFNKQSRKSLRLKHSYINCKALLFTLQQFVRNVHCLTNSSLLLLLAGFIEFLAGCFKFPHTILLPMCSLLLADCDDTRCEVTSRLLALFSGSFCCCFCYVTCCCCLLYTSPSPRDS